LTAAAQVAAPSPEPSRDCPLCPRLHDFIADWRRREPSWFNAPVPTFVPPEGEDAVRLLIVGLAPGLRGANRTGRPFTGDYAGDLLYGTLIAQGLARGEFKARPDDGLELVQTAITNAVRCVPPENKPVGGEIATCRSFLVPTIGRFPICAPCWRSARSRISPPCGRLGNASPPIHSAMADGSRPAASRCSRAITARATTPIRAC